MRRTRVLPFEFEVLKQLKAVQTDWSGCRILIAFSGGRDSQVLLHSLTAIQSRLGFELQVAHVHHGKSSDRQVNSYRLKAAKFSQKAVEDLNLKFHLLKHKGSTLSSEAEFRKAREEQLQNLITDLRIDWLAFGHHADDLLETRLIRLIRGTGPQGLQAMKFADRQKLRPLLHFTSEQIQAYADQKNLKVIEDPTNQDDKYFRNWIRNEWLPLLEKKRTGAIRSLARSLEHISENLVLNRIEKSGPDVIVRKVFSGLSVVEKREVLAQMMLHQGAKDFSRRQIDEILKRLSISRSANRRKMSFEVGGLQWRVNAEQIEAVRL